MILEHLVHQDQLLIAIQEKVLGRPAGHAGSGARAIGEARESDQRILDRLADNDEPV